MADWFDFKGRRSTDFGVRVQDYPNKTLPEERVTFTPVPGKSGSLTVLEGDNVYDDIILTINCYIRDDESLDQLSAWLRGAGNLVLGNTPDRYYVARVVNQIEMAKVIRGRAHRTFPAVFRCSPYRYLNPQPPAQSYTSSPGSINNSGTADAEPIITVVGSGDIELVIGAKTVAITGLASSITIDVPAGRAYNGTTPLDSTVSRDAYPLTIPPGISAVSWTGTVTSLTITKPWRYY